MKTSFFQRFNFDSLRVRLFVLVLLAIVPPVILTIYGAWKEREQAISMAEDNLQQMTQLAATSEARLIDGARQLMSVLSTVPELRGTPQACARFLADVQQRNEGYVNFGLIQLTGEVTCSAQPLEENLNLGNRTYFRQTVEQAKFVAGDYMFGTGNRKHAINLTYPVMTAKGQVAAVLFASLDLSYLDRFVSDIALPEGAVLITADSQGTIIARRPEPEKWIGTRTTPSLFDVMIKVGFGTSELTDADGITRLYAVAPVGTNDVSNFKVSIGIPMANIVAPANHLQMMELSTLAVIALLALIAAWFVGDVIILRRVKALLRTANQVTAGNLQARTGIKHGKEEISKLAHAFDTMVMSLQQNEADRAQTAAVLFKEKERAQVTLASIADAVITTDRRGHIEYMNPVAEELTGWTTAEAEGLPSSMIFRIFNSVTHETVQNPVEAVLNMQNSIDLSKDTVLLSRTGIEYAVEDSAAPIRDRDGKLIGVVLVFHDVSDSRKLAIQLSHQAAHDPLTGLFNRREFERRLELAIDNLARQPRQHALLYLDLDQFKIVNDTCGHSAGDELLRQITSLLQPLVRDSDTLARLGGDEFGAFLENCSPDSAEKIAEKLRQTICDFHFVWQDKIFPIGVSIGLVNFSTNNLSLPDLLSAADTACYIAKDSGRNRVHVYHAEDSQQIPREGEVKWNEKIQRAFEHDRFRLIVQSITPLQTQHSGPERFEELGLYMADPAGKLIPPSAFLPAAERYHYMPTIDRWIIRTAISRHSTSENAATHLLMLRISASSLNDDLFTDFIHEQFMEFRLPYSSICFALAETTAITNLTRARFLINNLKQRGCRFALDDFGSGMSSFAYLKHLDVDYLIIDGSYIKGMLTDPVDYAKVEAIQRIASVMGLQTIAQQVTTSEMVTQLSTLGICYAQGPIISTPHSFYPAEATLSPQ